MKKRRAFWLALFLAAALSARAVVGDFPALCADRTALERVYHDHRTGTKPPFEQAMPPDRVESLVRQDLHKEAVLRRVYGVEISDAQVQAEVGRIDTTTRAPETLAELKAALGGDPGRFARSLARPIVVERTLRARFENDDAIHAAQRREAERARDAALATRKEGVDRQRAALAADRAATDVTWQLTPRATEEGAAAPTPPPPATQGKASSGAYAVEATVQFAQVLNPPPGNDDQKFYFQDLDPELQTVLRAQLRQPGDVSAVIETPGGFLVFLTKARTGATLDAASLSVPKRPYEEWLAQQQQSPTP